MSSAVAVGPSMDDPSPPGAPRWVKVCGIIAAVVVLLVVIMLLAGGNHGPGRHLGRGREPSAGVQHSSPQP